MLYITNSLPIEILVTVLLIVLCFDDLEQFCRQFSKFVQQLFR